MYPFPVSVFFLFLQRQYSWVNKTDQAPNTTIGISNNERINRFGQSSQTRNNEDRYYSGCHGNIQLCMVLDGHQGESAAEFTVLSLAGKILSEPRIEDPKSLLERVFRETENSFFVGMDDPIGRRLALRAELSQRPAGGTFERHRDLQQDELLRLNSQIEGGTTVVLSLIAGNNQLYTANIGDSRAVLCEEDENGRIIASQLSDDHNVFNPEEQERLKKLGLDTGQLLQLRRLGPFQITRSIGDYLIKGGYTEVDVLRSASQEPGIATPFVNGPWDISNLQNKTFLILMSDGLYEAYGSCINTRNPPDLHSSLARLVADEMRLHNRIDRVGQAVVNRVKEQFKETCRRDRKDGKLDDMTLIIQNFTYPMGALPVSEQIDTPLLKYPSHSPFYSHMTPRVESPPGGVFVEENVSPFPSAGRQQSSIHYQQFGGHAGQMATGRSTGSMATGGYTGSMATGQSTGPMTTGRSTGPMAQPGSDNVQLVAQQMSGLNIKPKELFPPEGGQSAAASVNKPRELTKEEEESGKFIKPYIVFPNDFPFDLTLDSI